MTLTYYVLPAAAVLLLGVFYLGLPTLTRCRLPRAGARARRLGAGDWLAMALITLVYAAVAFRQLGNTDSPTSFVPMKGQEAVLTLPEGAEPAALMLFPGVSTGTYEIEVSADGAAYTPVTTFDQNYVAVLKWASVPLAEAPRPVRYLRLRCSFGEPYLGELALLDGAGKVLPAACSLPALCDENGTVPEKSDFMNSTYFDEIYHARTAWEHLNDIWPYEISHPPLGKEILSLGVLLFGMTPFGWRFSGTLLGVLMLPVMYLLLKKLFGGRAVPVCGTLVLASDFMHFVQTRIATIDTYAVFFILLMYLFLWDWLRTERPLPLALCGLSFGLGAACKWTCLYAGAGLAVLWLIHWGRRFLACRRSADGEHDEAVMADRRRSAGAAIRFPLLPFLNNVLLCLACFIALPAAIYYLSYLPYGRAMGCGPFSGQYLRLVLDNQRFMFNYHAGIVAEHPYSSRWYQWLLNIRPILYYLEYFPDGSRSSICAFLNPALCWGGFLSLFVLGYTALFRRDRRAGFILIGYLAQLLPWVFISRLTFAYHYFPSSVFLVLSLGYVFALFRENARLWLLRAAGFAAVSAGLFALFYPVLSGQPYGALGQFIQWLPTWPI